MPDQWMYRVRVASTGWGGAPGLNTFYFAVDDSIESDHDVAALDCASRVQALFMGLANIYPTLWVGTVQPDVDVINSDNGELLEAHAVGPFVGVTGSGGADFGPQAAMIVASYFTATLVDGHRVRGRSFFGPLEAGGDADGTPASGSLSAVSSASTSLLGGGTIHVPQVVWSRPRPISLAHPTGLGGSAPIITSVSVKDTFAILRSRRQ